METFKREWGLDWPSEVHPVFMDLVLAKHGLEAPYKFGNLLSPDHHLLRAARALFSPSEFKISGWTEEHAYDWCNSDFNITWGCAASSKSNDTGAFAVLDWVVDPTDTLTIMASTTTAMLELRSFESMLRYFRILKHNPHFLIPGKESRTRLAIVNEEDKDAEGPAATIKASIKGVAVHAGTVEEARANLQGAHLPYVRLILDELSAMREAAMEARHNLSIGTRNFKLVGLCNPDSLFDLACRYSVPVDGWGSVDPETSTHWKTRWGTVRRHDGFKSPAIKEPDEYPYLINQKAIDRIAAESGDNMDSAAIWTMVRGWPPPQGESQTVLTESMVTSYGMQSPVTWASDAPPPVRIAGLDPAFTSGGDAAILQPALVGHEAGTGLLVIAFEPFVHIPIKAMSARPDVYQVVDFVREWASGHDMSLDYLAVDESGTQRVGDMIEVESLKATGIQSKVVRVNFGAVASEFPVSVRRPDVTARREYSNQVTELWYAMQEYGSEKQVRGLPQEVANQFCRRKVLPKRPKRLEGKADMKKRIKRSPDHADAAACCLAVARWVLQVVPGSTKLVPGGEVAVNPGLSLDLVRFMDIDRQDRTYLGLDKGVVL